MWTYSTDTDWKKKQKSPINNTERRMRFANLDVANCGEPKYQTWSPYELTSAVISTDER